MPHDINGQILKEGDVVTVQAVIKTLYAGTDYCNVTLETVEPMFPGENKSTITLNAKQISRRSDIMDP